MQKILIVDDDRTFAEAVTIVLEAKGFAVAWAASRAEGMEAVTREHPDLILLDVMMEMPDDGFTMAHDLRKQGNKVPILMLSSVSRVTGLTFDKDPEMVPVDAFEEKPIAPEKLLNKIRELLA